MSSMSSERKMCSFAESGYANPFGYVFSVNPLEGFVSVEKPCQFLAEHGTDRCAAHALPAGEPDYEELVKGQYPGAFVAFKYENDRYFIVLAPHCTCIAVNINIPDAWKSAYLYITAK